MNKIQVLFYLCCMLALFSCGEDNNLSNAEREFQFTRKIENMDMENFQLPDSINTKLIIASYYVPESAIQTFLLYTDSSKTCAAKLDYLSDSSSSYDELEILKRNEFRSERYNVDYVVNANSVSIIHVRVRSEVSLSHGQEYKRTDRD